MKILIDHNEPFLLAHGGFQILIEKTAEALRREGLEVEYLRWWDAEQKGDIIHYFGRANPGSIHFAHAKGMRYVMHELLTSQGSRSRSQLRLQGFVNKLLRRALPSSFRLPLRWDSYKMADAIIASTKWEAWIMQTLFDAPTDRLHVVPTGVDEVFFFKAESEKRKVENGNSDEQRAARGLVPASSPSGRKQAPPSNFSNPQVSTFHFSPSTFNSPFLVTLATITERKRVVELAEAAILANVPLLVIGKPYSESDPYYLRFLDVVHRSKGLVTHESNITDPQVLAPILQACRGFVLLSTMETQSTAALAAAAAGCPLLLSDLPWARDTFGDRAFYFEKSNFTLGKLAEKLIWFYVQHPKHSSNFQILTWRDAGVQLREIYLEISAA